MSAREPEVGHTPSGGARDVTQRHTAPSLGEWGDVREAQRVYKGGQTRRAQPMLDYFGSKHMLANRIVDLMPNHYCYLEPYAGSGAVLAAKPRSLLETLNDLDCDIVNLFAVLREKPHELERALYYTPFSRQEHNSCREAIARHPPPAPGQPDVERARLYIAASRQGRGVVTASGWRNQVDRFGAQSPLGVSGQFSFLWERVEAWTERLRTVQIECRPALDVISRHATPDTLIYADPPYIKSTRTPGLYTHDAMTDADHAEMLDALVAHPGPALVSGYAHPLYEEALAGWSRHQWRGMGRENTRSRTEVLWSNPKCSESTPTLF